MKREDVVAAHRHCAHHREAVLASEKCGCFYCLEMFPPSAILDWIDEKDGGADVTDEGQTALCPKCGIDSVIGSSSGYPITPAFLKAMNDHWFQTTMRIEPGTAGYRR